MELIYENKFRSELKEICLFIAKDSPNRSLIFNLEVENICQSLTFIPNRFPKNNKYSRFFIYKKYKIIYSVHNNKIIILSIIKNKNI